MGVLKLYHVSEDPDIKIFEPRLSPSYFKEITGPVVFAVTEQLLHNYLLPRDCPRVTFYAGAKTSQSDKEKILGTASHVVAVEEDWLPRIQQTILYCYEFHSDGFVELDANAGYYISYNAVTPVTVNTVAGSLSLIEDKGVEVRSLSNLQALAKEIAESSLCFSFIRMRNAKP